MSDMLAIEERGERPVGGIVYLHIEGLRVELVELDADGLDPLAIGLAVGELGLELGVINDAALLEIDQEHLAGLQPPLLDLSLIHLLPRRPSYASYRRAASVLPIIITYDL